MPKTKSARLLVLTAAIAFSAIGCGGDDEPDAPAAAEADSADELDDPADGGGSGSASDSGGSGSDAGSEGAELECDLPDGLSERLAQERQLVLNLAMAEGDNLETVESAGAPDPETFRSVADVLDGLDLSGIATNPQFDEPADVVAGLNDTADLLEAALAAGTDTADPAWPALSEFYTQEFFVRHSASVGYYLTEAGCI